MTQLEKHRKLVKNIEKSLEDIRTQVITAPNGLTNALLISIAENLALIADSLLEKEYKSKVKELEDAIAKCEKAEEDFKKRTCKFRSPTNCNFCSFHSDCSEHWEEGEEK